MTSDTLTGGRADILMRRLLRVTELRPGAIMGARSAMSRSLVISGIRCVITYLLVPILVPAVAILGTVAGPLSIVLCLYAMVNGVVSVRRFWLADHRTRWAYTGFMAVVFLLLGAAIAIDVAGLFA